MICSNYCYILFLAKTKDLVFSYLHDMYLCYCYMFVEQSLAIPDVSLYGFVENANRYYFMWQPFMITVRPDTLADNISESDGNTYFVRGHLHCWLYDIHV